MKIINKIKRNWCESDIKECLRNIKDFDYTQLEDSEIFEVIKQSLIQNECLCGKYRDIDVNYIGARMDVFEDGKTYPEIYYDIDAFLENKNRLPDTARIVINPFVCTVVVGNCLWEEKAKKHISKALRDFMVEKFGAVYTDKRDEYLLTVKSQKILKAKNKYDKSVKEAEEEFKENMFEI